MATNRARLRVCILVLCLSLSTTLFTRCDARKQAHIFKPFKNSRSSRPKKLNAVKHLDIATAMDSSSTNTQPYVSSPFSLPPFDSLAPMPLPENTTPPCDHPSTTLPPPSTTIPGPAGIYTPPLPPSTTFPTPSSSQPQPLPPTSTTFPTPSSSQPQPLPPPSTTFPTPSSSEPQPLPPSVSTPTLPIDNPPPSPMVTVPSPSSYIPSPSGYIPNPPIYIPSPTEPGIGPPSYEPSPPSYELSPPSLVPSPTVFTPSPPIFQPPVVYPPPTGPPTHHAGPGTTLWCVAKPSVPDPIIKEAMNYACGSGADCDSLQPNGSCFEPNTLIAHASYAFNSYWQRTKAGGGTCEFGGTAILVTVDPSYDGCQFIYY